ncbi:AraC family transcriptional regulator [Rhizobium sp. L43]|uniref:AraC family transcriptional regulator n=1 Tax=Rhizobium sp. L43 TaxID=2035452 RepID=UPI000BE93A00|nr:AraC family transcriptional regulator [Rhizobium sp. L43]PDS75623.1 AraC family transcriptional regulator [Rhizobium sp. L43]
MPQASWNAFDHLSFAGTDLQELSTSLSRLRSGIDVRPEGSRKAQYQINMVRARGISIIASVYDGDFSIHFPASAETIMVLIPLTGSATVTVPDRKLPSIQNQGIFLDGQSNGQLRIAGPRTHLCLSVPHLEFARRIEARLNASLRGRLRFANEIDLSQGSGLDVARLAITMHHGLVGETLRKSPGALGHLLGAMLELLIDAIPHNYSQEFSRDRKSPVPWHVKRAIHYMHGNISEVMTLKEIAEACGVSPRTLQDGFRKFRMTTPMAYLEHLRLDVVRQELSSAHPDQSVRTIAQKWGFAHLGRFSGQYRKRFGELPSQTLSRIGENPADAGKADADRSRPMALAE